MQTIASVFQENGHSLLLQSRVIDMCSEIVPVVTYFPHHCLSVPLCGHVSVIINKAVIRCDLQQVSCAVGGGCHCLQYRGKRPMYWDACFSM